MPAILIRDVRDYLGYVRSEASRLRASGADAAAAVEQSAHVRWDNWANPEWIRYATRLPPSEPALHSDQTTTGHIRRDWPSSQPGRTLENRPGWLEPDIAIRRPECRTPPMTLRRWERTTGHGPSNRDP